MLQPKERLAAGAKWIDTGYIFTTKIGAPIEPDSLRRDWYPLRVRVVLGGDAFP
ncbi:hypothetical protein [Kribbella qitaiheensis]|uniref:hypothetical protein n=1 Tax=Kribbella qitaiheensis TaxID=1544730 RepID=UPI0019D5F320|nr:hypothetical protein [Kribbella qitaiheensis]